MIKPLLFILAATCLMGSARADVQFSCPSQLAMLRQEVPRYLLALGIPAKQFTQAADSGSGTLLLTLTTPADDTRTLDFSSREEFSPATERIYLPTAKGTTRAVQTVSKKEIGLALLQHGRVTEFSGEACSLEALADHVGVRQNIVA